MHQSSAALAGHKIIDKIVWVKDIATDFENLCAWRREKILN
jgi:hypothetical protein